MMHECRRPALRCLPCGVGALSEGLGLTLPRHPMRIRLAFGYWEASFPAT
jgi:hypothetical protein